MTVFLAHPGALWTFALVAALAILHLLAPRWKRRIVPSLVLWRRVAASGVELRSRRPRADISFLLGTLGAGALALAASGPRLLAAAASGREIAIVVDNGTASLTEGARGRTRLADALALARAELDSLGGSDRAAVLVTSPSPRVVEPMGPPERAAGALARIEPVQVSGSLAEATALAHSLGSGLSPAPEVVVFASRRGPLSGHEARWVPVGREGRNLAIVSADFSDEQAFCALRNFASREALARASLRILEPSPPREIASLEARIPPLGRSALVLEPLGHETRLLAEARVVEISHSWAEDDLPVDDRALAARVAVRARRVGIVGEASESLLRALWAARAEAIVLAGPSAAAATEGRSDCLVYCRELPASWPPPASALLVSPKGSSGPLEILEDELRDVRGVFAPRDDRSLVRGFPPVELNVRRARRVRIFAPHEVLISAGAEPLAASLRGGHAYLGFVPEESDWPERASFPVFVARFLEEAARSAGGSEAVRTRLAYARVGETPGELLGPGALAVRSETGGELPQGSRLLAAGLYRSGDMPLAVNLVSERESDNGLSSLAPRHERRESPADADSPARRVAETVLAPVLAVAALALLAAEWLVSARRS